MDPPPGRWVHAWVLWIQVIFGTSWAPWAPCAPCVPWLVGLLGLQGGPGFKAPRRGSTSWQGGSTFRGGGSTPGCCGSRSPLEPHWSPCVPWVPWFLGSLGSSGSKEDLDPERPGVDPLPEKVDPLPGGWIHLPERWIHAWALWIQVILGTLWAPWAPWVPWLVGLLGFCSIFENHCKTYVRNQCRVLMFLLLLFQKVREFILSFGTRLPYQEVVGCCVSIYVRTYSTVCFLCSFAPHAAAS